MSDLTTKPMSNEDAAARYEEYRRREEEAFSKGQDVNPELEQAKLAPELRDPTGSTYADFYVGEQQSVEEVLRPKTRGEAGLGGYVEENGGARWIAPRRRQEGPKPDPRLVETAEEMVTIAREFWKSTGETKVGAKGLDKPVALVGLTHEQQVAHEVGITPGFHASHRWIMMGPRYTPEPFLAELAKRMPFRSVPRREEDCTADLPIVTVAPARYDVT